MKKILFALLGLGVSTAVTAQELPMPSPAASVMQRVGLTDITVEYSRPSKKERVIFGELVPYDKMWRTGANANTTVEFSTDVLIAGKALAAGKYSLFTIPGKEKWVIALNKNTSLWGVSEYNEEEDVLRFEIAPAETKEVETFTIGFANLTPNTAHLVLAWEETAVHIPIKVDSKSQALKNIEAAIAKGDEESLWRVYRNAANYYYQNEMNLAEAEGMIDKSISMKGDSWYSYWLKASILAAQKKNEAAVKSAKKALEMGYRAAEKKGSEFGYAEAIEADIKKWKA